MRIRSFNQKEPVPVKVEKVVVDTHGGLQDILAIVLAHKVAQKNGNLP